MKKLILILICLILTNMTHSEGKAFYIDRVTAVAEDKISVVAYKRDDNGKYIGVEVLLIDKEGNLLSFANCNILIDLKNGLLKAAPLFIDSDNFLWLNTWTKIGKISLEKLGSKDFSEENLAYLLPAPDLDENIIFKKDSIFILPNLVSLDKGKSWIKLFRWGWGDMYPREDCESGATFLDNYAMELSSSTIYNANVKLSDRETDKIILSKYDVTNSRWLIDDIINLKKDEKAPSTMEFPFLISEKYVVMSDDFEKDNRVIIVYDRIAKKYVYYRDVARECSDYDIVGLVPQAIVDDNLFCECPLGGYINFNLKTGNIRKDKFGGKVCIFYQSPNSSHLLINAEGKLFISFDKGENWKEILDVSKVNLSKADVVLDKKEVKR